MLVYIYMLVYIEEEVVNSKYIVNTSLYSYVGVERGGRVQVGDGEDGKKVRRWWCWAG
jgi:hypothetical protein